MVSPTNGTTFLSFVLFHCIASANASERQGSAAMIVTFEINFALWIMIGCAIEKAVQFVEYLN